MDKKGWKVWNNLTFKTQGYRKNFDLATENDSIVTLYNGTISELRLSEKIPPIVVGEYGFSVWHLSLGKALKANLNKLIRAHSMENIYDELITLIENKKFEIDKYDKIVFIHGLVIHPDYRKIGVTEEFIESIYRDFYGDNVGIIALVKPIQDNVIDADFYFRHKTVPVRNNLTEIDLVPAVEYYSLADFMGKTDTEINEYKLYSVAQKCGFERINSSHLFIFSPEKIVERMMEKQQLVQSTDN